jgi:hypothetical protein
MKFKSGREGENKSNENQANEHDDLFYRCSVPKNLVPVEEVTKTGSISTLSLSQTVSLASLTKYLRIRIEKKKVKPSNKRNKRTQEHPLSSP